MKKYLGQKIKQNRVEKDELDKVFQLLLGRQYMPHNKTNYEYSFRAGDIAIIWEVVKFVNEIIKNDDFSYFATLPDTYISNTKEPIFGTLFVADVNCLTYRMKVLGKVLLFYTIKSIKLSRSFL